jgi:hypothetical protein
LHDLGLKYRISTLGMNNKKEWGFMYQTPTKVELNKERVSVHSDFDCTGDNLALTE